MAIPLWGDQAKRDYELEKQRIEAAKFQKELEAKIARLDAMSQKQMGGLSGGIFQAPDPFGIYGNPYLKQPPPRVRQPGELTDKMLNEGVYSMPLSAARDLWRVKFGDQWTPFPQRVSKNVDEQIVFLAQRLLANGCFEKVDSVLMEGPWNCQHFVRLKED